MKSKNNSPAVRACLRRPGRVLGVVAIVALLLQVVMWSWHSSRRSALHSARHTFSLEAHRAVASKAISWRELIARDNAAVEKRKHVKATQRAAQDGATALATHVLGDVVDAVADEGETLLYGEAALMDFEDRLRRKKDRLEAFTGRATRHFRTHPNDGWGRIADPSNAMARIISDTEAQVCAKIARAQELRPRARDALPGAHVDIYAFPPRRSLHGREVKLSLVDGATDSAFDRAFPLRSLSLACFIEADVCRETSRIAGLPRREAVIVNALLVAADELAAGQGAPSVFLVGGSVGIAAFPVWQHPTVRHVTIIDEFPPSLRLAAVTKCINRRVGAHGAATPLGYEEQIVADVAHADQALDLVNAVIVAEDAGVQLGRKHCAVRSTTRIGEPGLFELRNMSRVYCPLSDRLTQVASAPAADEHELVYDVAPLTLTDALKKAPSGPLVVHLDTKGLRSANDIIIGSPAAFEPHRPGEVTASAATAGRRIAFLAVEVYSATVTSPAVAAAGGGRGGATIGANIAAAPVGDQPAAESVAPSVTSVPGRDETTTKKHVGEEGEEDELIFVDYLTAAGYLGYAHHLHTFFVEPVAESPSIGALYFLWREVNLRVSASGLPSETVAFALKPSLHVFTGRTECIVNPYLFGAGNSATSPLTPESVLGEHSFPATQIVTLDRDVLVAVPAAIDGATENLVTVGDAAQQGWASRFADVFHAAEALKGNGRTVRYVDVGGALGVDAIKMAKAGYRVTSVQPHAALTRFVQTSMCLNGIHTSHTPHANTADPDLNPVIVAVDVIGQTDVGACELFVMPNHASRTVMVCPDASPGEKKWGADHSDFSLGHRELASLTSLGSDANETVILMLASGFHANTVLEASREMLLSPWHQPVLILTPFLSASDIFHFATVLLPLKYVAFAKSAGVFLDDFNAIQNFVTSAQSDATTFELHWVKPDFSYVLLESAGRRHCNFAMHQVPAVKVVTVGNGGQVACSDTTVADRVDPALQCVAPFDKEDPNDNTPSTALRRGLFHAASIFAGRVIDESTAAHIESVRQRLDNSLMQVLHLERSRLDTQMKEARISLQRNLAVVHVGPTTGSLAAHMLFTSSLWRAWFVTHDPASPQLVAFSACVNGLEDVPLLRGPRDLRTIPGAKAASRAPWLVVDTFSKSDQDERNATAATSAALLVAELWSISGHQLPASRWKRLDHRVDDPPAPTEAPDGAHRPHLQDELVLYLAESPTTTPCDVQLASAMAIAATKRPALVYTLCNRDGFDLANATLRMVALGYRGFVQQLGLHIETHYHAYSVQRAARTPRVAIVWRDAAPTTKLDTQRYLLHGTPQCAVPFPGVLDAYFVPTLQQGLRVACPVTSGLNGALCLPVPVEAANLIGRTMTKLVLDGWNSVYLGDRRFLWFIDINPRDGTALAADVVNQGASVLVIEEIPAHYLAAQQTKCLRLPPAASIEDITRNAAENRDDAMGNGFVGPLRLGVLNARLSAPDGNANLTKCRVVPSKHLPDPFDPDRDQMPMKLDCTNGTASPNLKSEKKSLGATLKRWRVPQLALDAIVANLAKAFGRRTDGAGRPPLPVLRLRLWDGALPLLEGAKRVLQGTTDVARPLKLVLADVDCRATRLLRILQTLMAPTGLIAIPPALGTSMQFLLAPESVVQHCAQRQEMRASLEAAPPGPQREAAQKRLRSMNRPTQWFFAALAEVDRLFSLTAEEGAALHMAKRHACRVACAAGGTAPPVLGSACSCAEFRTNQA